jgi:hypothetical protein
VTSAARVDVMICGIEANVVARQADAVNAAYSFFLFIKIISSFL